MSGPLSINREPSIPARIFAPVARLSLKVQDGLAQLVGFKNSGNASKVVTVAGFVTLAVSGLLGPLGPAVYGAGLWTAGVGAGGMIENKVTKNIAESDGKGKFVG